MASEQGTAQGEQKLTEHVGLGHTAAAAINPRWAGAARVGLLGAADALALLAAGATAFLLWAHPVRGQDIAPYLPAAPAALLIVLGYGQAGLYPGFGLGPVEVLRRYWLVTTTAFVAVAAMIFGLKLQEVYSRMTLALAFVLSLAFIAGSRWIMLRIVRRVWWWPERVILVGNGRRTELARRVLSEGSRGEFASAGEIHLGRTGEAGFGDQAEGLDEAERYARSGIQTAFADLEGRGAEAALDRLRLLFPRVIILREFDELPVEGVQVRNLGGALGLEYGNNLLRRQSRWVKRALDLAVGGLALILTLPVALSCMLAVKILSPGPALFWHEREGPQGRRIRVPKIRTMVVDAEERVEELLRTQPRLRREWESSFKLKDDPRVIRGVGELFRRFSIDELPQLWSVFRGDMSLVGPRPFPSYHLDALSTQARRLRDEVRPGLTGLWQISARGVADVEAQQAYDVYYIRNWSIWLDLYILARTARAVISGKGAY